MPITIVRRDKPFKVKCGDSLIHVTPQTAEQDAALREAHTRDGQLNADSYWEARLEAEVTGWEGVHDQDGESVPFKKEYILGLPLDVQVRLVLCLRGKADPLADRSMANSPPSSASTSSTPSTGG